MNHHSEINDKSNGIPRHQPIVKFGDDEYICDDINQTFIRHGEPFNLIGFDRLIEITTDSSSYLVYDQKNHAPAKFPELDGKIPMHILLIKLPPIELLNPLGFAIWYKVVGPDKPMAEVEFNNKMKQIYLYRHKNTELGTCKSLCRSRIK